MIASFTVFPFLLSWHCSCSRLKLSNVLPAVDAAERSSLWQDVVFDCLSAIISMTNILFINNQISSPPPRVIDSEPLKVNPLLSAVVKLQIYIIYFYQILYLKICYGKIQYSVQRCICIFKNIKQRHSPMFGWVIRCFCFPMWRWSRLLQ